MREQHQVGKGARKEKDVSLLVSHQFMLRSCRTCSEQSVDKEEEKLEKKKLTKEWNTSASVRE